MTTNLEIATGLRDLADFLMKEETPQLGSLAYEYLQEDIMIFCKDRAQIADVARRIGAAEKEFCTGYFKLVKRFGPISLQFTIEREKVCKLIETKKLVTMPATEAVEALPERVVEVIETQWDCAEPLLAMPKPAAPTVQDVAQDLARAESIAPRAIVSPLLS